MTLALPAPPTTLARLVFDRRRTDQQVGRGCLQRRRNQLDVVDADVSQAPLDAADVRPVETALEGKLLLRPAERLPAFADISRKSSSELHRSEWSRLQPMRLQPLSLSFELTHRLHADQGRSLDRDGAISEITCG